MLSIARRVCNNMFVEAGCQESRRKPAFISSLNEHSLAVGLHILTQISSSSIESNTLVIKPAALKNLDLDHLGSLSCHHPCNDQYSSSCKRKNESGNELSWFLKSCCFCNKPLAPDKDVYMYRGDQGFCSTECRDRQIVIDEKEEMEAAALNKRMAAAYTSSGCHAGGRCETCKLLKEFRQRRWQPGRKN
ncbi:hypothetical protein Ancab_011884 [Ancistrocladus abbreviatus]